MRTSFSSLSLYCLSLLLFFILPASLYFNSPLNKKKHKFKFWLFSSCSLFLAFVRAGAQRIPQVFAASLVLCNTQPVVNSIILLFLFLLKSEKSHKRQNSFNEEKEREPGLNNNNLGLLMNLYCTTCLVGSCGRTTFRRRRTVINYTCHAADSFLSFFLSLVTLFHNG